MKRYNILLALIVMAAAALSCDRDEFFDEEQQLELDTATIRSFLKDRSLMDQFQLDTPTNIFYRIDVQGTGEKPLFGSTVIVHYDGFLLDGTVFDTSAERGPLDFVLGRGDVVQGWDIAFSLIEKGTSATFLLPSGLGYGNAGRGTLIPPNTVLMFEVRLLDIR